MLSSDIDVIVTRFLEVFNANDLDLVMAFFRDDAVYEPGDGRTHKGKAEIRAAFEPQFQGTLGAMRFVEHDRIIDSANRKVVCRWVCRHDISQLRSRGFRNALKKLLVRTFAGERFGWNGLDVFHFDADGKIEGKFTYGWFGRRPYLMRGLGWT